MSRRAADAASQRLLGGEQKAADHADIDRPDEEFKKIRLRDRDYYISLAYIERANIYRDRGDFDKAMADYEAALAAWEHAAYAVYGNRGILYERQGAGACGL